jgi:cobalt-zinc-cadmium efflux system outer membrane protein
MSKRDIASALLALVAGISGASAHAQAPPLPSVLTLEWCLERAREANPHLAGARAQADASKSRIDAVRALEDPSFSYEASNLPVSSFDFDSTPLSGHQLTLQQKLPLPGLLSNRKKAAERSADADRLLVEDERLRVEGAVESAWAELVFARQAENITERNVGLLRQLAKTAESRYRVGTGLQQDALRAQVELTALLQDGLRREQAIAYAEASLIALLDLPPQSELPRIARADLRVAAPELAPLLEGLEQRSARLRAAKARVQAARARVDTARHEGFPDLDVGLGYRVREDVPGDPVAGDDFFSAKITVRLPVYRSKWKAKVAQKRSLVRRAEAEYRAEHASLAMLTRRAHAELVRAASEEALLATGLVPQAQQSLDSSRSAYKVGRIDFLSLLDSQVRLLDAELQLARSRADRRLAFATLEAAAGEKLR